MPSCKPIGSRPKKAYSGDYKCDKASHKVTLDALFYLRQRKQSALYVSEDDMRQLNIRCTDLELDPTLFPPRTDALLELMPAQEMQQLAETFNFESERDNLEWPVRYSDFDEAKFMFTLLLDLLRILREPRHDETLEPYKGLPRVGVPGEREYQLLRHMRSMGGAFMDRPICHLPPRRLEPASHVFCDGWGSSSGRCAPVQRAVKHKIIPVSLQTLFPAPPPKEATRVETDDVMPKVTVISGCCKQLRIVQGYANGETGTIELRKSPIVNFEEAQCKDRADERWHDFLTFLRWILARPVGKTT
ncbi:hypothetical protein O1611_g5804 [Lasiodiplodia mahajangana]|uniref:Uncharacterized protein n=1 Tax=Lasiodiplodia mahajangana TaxID=1108764 RepID=A0ACC2JKE9_9PEZI|nr:hypothetical protein O1611_g5804 [Lasiodiplodia mahajangana]